MIYTLSNSICTATINSVGAELTSLQRMDSGIEYMWQAEEQWPKHAPILFPFIGCLKEGQYSFEGKEYKMTKHGFVREREFNVVLNTLDEIAFSIKSDENTKSIYPFDFEFIVRFKLESNRLIQSFEVKNTGVQTMYFMVGAHPAFKVPIANIGTYDQYVIEFEKKETLNTLMVDLTNGLRTGETREVLNNGDVIHLSQTIFENDALVFENINSSSVIVRNERFQDGLKICFEGFPVLAIWAKPRTDFVCIEPWYGICDTIQGQEDLSTWNHIQTLPSNGFFSSKISIEII